MIELRGARRAAIVVFSLSASSLAVGIMAITATATSACGVGAVGNPCGCDADVDASVVVDAAANVDVAVDTGPPVRTDCFGKTTDAVFICDGFEGKWDEAWKPVILPAGNPAHANIATVASPKLAGNNSLETSFSKMPNQGVAKLVYEAREESLTHLALQFTVNIPEDAWTVGQDVPLGGLISLTRSAIVYFVPTGGTAGRFEVRITGDPVPLVFGDVAMSKANLFDTWQCIELAYDGSRLTAFVSKLKDAGVPLPQDRVVVLSPSGAEVGIEWNHSPNENAGKKIWFEDAVVSRSPIGCIH